MTDAWTETTGEPPIALPHGDELPRLLAGIPASGHMSLDEHETLRGPLPTQPGGSHRTSRRGVNPLIDELAAAGLRGRGGAGFPTATKLQAVAGARGRSVVVVNGTDGEPASVKDRTLLELVPHLVLDGAQLAAEAVGAKDVVVAACELAVSSVEALTAAIEEREAAFDPRDTPRINLALVPASYVAGQETALVNHLNGGPAIPTFTPPRVYESGVAGRPTLVNNAETLANIALIGRYGSSWFRQLGTAAEPGTVLITLSGPVAHPSLYEIAVGASLGSLLQRAGGMQGQVHAALIGGYAGSWVDASQLADLALADELLASQGASLGAGIVVLLSEAACPVAETARLARWLAGQSTRQCGPCVHGLDELAGTIERAASGQAQGHDGRRIDRLSALTARRGACGHPDGAVRVLVSGLRLFWDAFSDHARHGACEACARAPELPLPPRPRGTSRRGARSVLR